MRIAFHTPLKPVDHPTPSGDRAMARELLALLQGLGHRVSLVTRFDGQPNLPPAATHLAQARRGRVRAAAIVRRWRSLPAGHPERFDLWFTYHLYYKKPDWLGPDVADQLGIPYVVAEASHAPKRRHSVWRIGHRMVERALRRADLVLNMNPVDSVCVRPLLRSRSVARPLAPFLDAAALVDARGNAAAHRQALVQALGLRPDVPVLLAVAMMRPPDKLASYEVLARALSMLLDRQWQLVIVGDGEARTSVERLFAPMTDRIRFMGALPPAQLPTIYAAADMLVWPAINEAYGMILLEAQAAGLAVVAGRTGGVPAVVQDGSTGLLSPIGDAQAFAAAVARLLDQPDLLSRLRMAAPQYIAGSHSRQAVSRRLQRDLVATQASSTRSCA